MWSRCIRVARTGVLHVGSSSWALTRTSESAGPAWQTGGAVGGVLSDDSLADGMPSHPGRSAMRMRPREPGDEFECVQVQVRLNRCSSGTLPTFDIEGRSPSISLYYDIEGATENIEGREMTFDIGYDITTRYRRLTFDYRMPQL
jgi:hypothetical protein